MNSLFCLIFSFVSAIDSPAYPFSHFHNPDYEQFDNWRTWDRQDLSDKKVHTTIEVDSFFTEGGKLTIQVTADHSEAQSRNVIRLYKNKEWMQAFEKELGFPVMNPRYMASNPVKVADLNGDGLPDFRILYDPHSNGLSLGFNVMYFIQQPTGRFIRYSVNQLFEDKAMPLEYDFNYDGAFEFLSINLVSIGSHNYWRFQVYEFVDDEFRCVSQQFGYPIFIQFKHVQNFMKYTGVVPEGLLQCPLENGPAYKIDKGRF